MNRNYEVGLSRCHHETLLMSKENHTKKGKKFNKVVENHKIRAFISFSKTGNRSKCNYIRRGIGS